VYQGTDIVKDSTVTDCRN